MSGASGRSGIVAIAVTRRGAELARALSAAMPGVAVRPPARFALAGETAHSGAAAAVAEAFGEAEGLVLFMATGVAVRLVAPLLRDKHSDPAIVVVDESGRFAISLLAGHLGGANELAERVAAALGAQPVITTASEAAGVPSPDLIGREWGWRIDPARELTAVAAALVNGDPVGVVQECGEEGWLPDPPPAHITLHESLDELVWTRPAAALIVTDRAELPATPNCPYALYRPRTLALGAGSSRNAPPEELAALACESLTIGRFAPECVGAVASIDLKRDESAIVALAERFGVPLITYGASELEAMPGAWTRSEVVRAAVGAGGVAEPAALLAAGPAARLVIAKRKSAHATIAIARCPRGHGVGT